VKHFLEPTRLFKSEIIESDTKGTILIIELNPKSNSRTVIKIDADLKYGKIGIVIGIFAKTETDNLINRFANAEECSN
jgi:hypothetical protein